MMFPHHRQGFLRQGKEATEPISSFTFDLDVENAAPFVQSFSFPLRGGKEGRDGDDWRSISVSRPNSANQLLLLERIELTGSREIDRGRPFILLKKDGRYVGKAPHSLCDCDVGRPEHLAEWIVWDARRAEVTGLCEMASVKRGDNTGPIEARNEERFYMSDLYKTLSRMVVRKVAGGNSTADNERKGGEGFAAATAAAASWYKLEEAHFGRSQLDALPKGAVFECLKKKYQHCPFVGASAWPLQLEVLLKGEEEKEEEKAAAAAAAAAYLHLHLEGRIVDAVTTHQLRDEQQARRGSYNIRSAFCNDGDFEEWFRTILVCFTRTSVR